MGSGIPTKNLLRHGSLSIFHLSHISLTAPIVMDENEVWNWSHQFMD
jgi:hypothetical protein